MGQRKYYNLMVVPDGVENPVRLKVRAWIFKLLVASFVVLIVGIIIFFALYGKIVARAALADKLEAENEALQRYKYKVILLEERIKEAQEIVGRISMLAGVDISFPEMPPDSVIFAEVENTAPAIMARSAEKGDRIPEGLPLRGFMTRGFEDDSASYHPGIDIAAAEGTPVLATASGKVVYAGEDSVYGLIVVIEHDNGISTVYGHNSQLLVKEGQEVPVGSRIALSGNTGQSTAPHLHYEIRENNKPINPMKYMSNYEESNNQK
jgi:murein DD-endopeptidase MepM/ murein hydrolase activator NlpD